MSGGVWARKAVVGAVVVGLFSLPGCRGAPGTPEDVDAAPSAVDGSVPGADAPEAAAHKAPKKEPSLPVGGHARLSVDNFTMDDKQGRNVLRVKKVTGTMNLGAMRHGEMRLTNTKVEGVEVTLYRDETGKLSLADALKKEPPTIRRCLSLPPQEKHEKGPWLMEIGPVEVHDATLTIGFTKKPVIFHVDSAVITVRRERHDPGPVIYIQQVQGHMMKPKPLPKPVRIAWANGLVNLVGKPLVHLAARTCIRKSELRVDAVVEARKEPAHLIGDSAGLGGALGRMGIRIASRLESNKLTYRHEAVHIDGGPGCKEPEVPLVVEAWKPKQAHQAKREPKPEAQAVEAPAPTESKHEHREERREEHREERHEKHAK